MHELGKLTSWDDARGFGFITPLKGEGRIFVHISEFPRERRPVGDEMLRYIRAMDERGRAKALQVEFLTSSHEPHLFYWTPIAIATLGIASVFLIGLVFAGFTKHLPLAIPVVYTILSVITFQQYLIDKKAAQSDRWRIPEKQLHLLSLLGGWPGALVAQQGLRHKSRKTSFLIPFCITIGLNLAPLVLFFYYLGN